MCAPITGDRTFDPGKVFGPDSYETKLAAMVIAQLESGGDYKSNPVHPNGATASGAFQITDQTWQAWARASGNPDAPKYARAYQAPPEVQNAVAKWKVAALLNQHRQLASVPVNWYWPRAWTNCAELENRPAGNPITVRAYAEKWLAEYNKVDTAWQQSTDTAGPTDAIQPAIDAVTGTLDALGQIAAYIGRAASWVGNPNNWLRIIEVIGGAALIAVAALMLTRDLSPVAAVAQLAGR